MTNNSKVVVVTGASSFVGFHLARGFSNAGWTVVSTGSFLKSEYKGAQAERLKHLNTEWCSLDIRDIDAANKILQQYRPRLWIHHAGYAKNYTSSDYDIKLANSINVDPLYQLYPKFAELKTSVIVTGSSMEYSNTDSACCESDPCFPEAPYGLSKLTETLAAMQLSKIYNVPTRVARLFIPYGPFDTPTKLIPSVLAALREGASVDMSPCMQKRDFVYVDDLVAAYHALSEDLCQGGAEIYNISSGKAVPVRMVIDSMATHLKVPHALLRYGAREMRPGEPMVSYGSNEKIKQKLGWVAGPLEDRIGAYLDL